MAEKEKAKGGKTSGPKLMSVSKLYKVESHKVSRLKKRCPKCGDGYFMAQHKDRATCGKCHYMEKVVKSN